MYMENDLEIFSHLASYVEHLLDLHSFKELKRQKCFVGISLFYYGLLRQDDTHLQTSFVLYS